MPPPSEFSAEQSSGVSSAENVAFIASTHSSHNRTSASSSPAAEPDPLAIDGGVTVRSGGVPLTAWESSAAELAKLLVGKQLGPFAIEAALGSGGMAAVFRAYDPLLDRRVALKILPPLLAKSPEQVQRFEREAKAAAKLDDEHVARVHQYGQDQGLHYIAYEFVEGTNLRDLMEKQGGRLPVVDAICFAMQAAQGLAHASTRGIIHRDIKPSNLVVTASGQVKLVDLGLARHSLEEDAEHLTHSGATLGTFDYLAPEQAIDPRLADVRSDIYSLGCTLYHCITGRPPVPQGTAAQKLHSHQQELPPDPRDLNPEVPAGLVDVLCKMLAKQPKDRYQTAEELVADLQKLSLTIASITPATDARQSAAKATSDPLGYLWIVGLVILCAGIIGWDSWTRGRGAKAFDPAGQLAFSAEKKNKESDQEIASKETPEQEKNSRPINVEVSSGTELLQAFNRAEGGTIILKENLYELSPDRNEGNAITIRNGNWQVRPAEGAHPVLRLTSGTADRFDSHISLFNLLGGALHLARIAIEIKESSGNETVVGFLVGSGTTLTLVDCELKQIGHEKEGLNRVGKPDTTMIQMATGNGGDASETSVHCQGCLWHGGDCAIEAQTAGLIEWENCWVGPYQQTMVLPALSGSVSQKRIITVKQCCIAQAKQACFSIAGSSPIFLETDRSFFSRCAPSARNAEEGVWILKDAVSTASVDVVASETYFYRLNGFYAVESGSGGKEVLVRDWHQLRTMIPRLRDVGSLMLFRSPWLENKPWQRFQETGQIQALALKDEYREWGPQTLLGQSLHTVSAAVQNSAIPNAAARTGKTLIVDGRGEDPGTFTTLNSAIGSITDEEETTILLQLPGTVPIKPSELGNSRIIIKSGEGVTPELVFHRDTVSGPDGDAVLFRLHDGELTLENIRIRLDALRDPARSLAVVAISGVGKCRVKDSIVTLKGSSDLSEMLCLVTDPTGMMAQQAGKSARLGLARLEVVESLVRGVGDLLHVQTSRPFSAALQQSGIALEGTALVVEGNRADMTMTSEGAQVQLDHATVWASKGFLHLHGTASMPQLVPVRVQSSNSLLAATEAQPLIRIDATQNDSEMKRRLTWMGKRNCYVAAGPMIISQAFDRESMTNQYDSTLWSDLWGGDDEQAQVVKTTPLVGMNRSTNVAEWEPRDWATKVESGSMLNLRDIGVAVEQLPSVHAKP